MKVEFGVFEKSPNEDKIKDFLTKYFKTLKNSKFKSAYIAYPHNAYSDVYQPEQSSPDVLEMYLFSIPPEIPKNTVSFQKIESIYLDEDAVSLSGFQRDGYRLSVPNEFTSIFDTERQLIAVVKDNKIWVTFDIFHDFPSNFVNENNISTILQIFSNDFYAPISKEEKRKILLEKINGLITTKLQDEIKKREEKVETYKSEIRSSQDRIDRLLHSYSGEIEVLNALKTTKPRTGKDVLLAMEALPFIEEVTYQGGRTLMAHTHEIKVGPFTYGKWKIGIRNGSKIDMRHESNTFHPYEFDPEGPHASLCNRERHRFCFGGFEGQVKTAINCGHYDEALKIIRLELTQYSVGSRMNNIEPFFKGIMGKKFTEIINEVKKRFTEPVSEVCISKIQGNKVTFMGKQTIDGRNVNVAEKVVIEYD